MLKTVNSERLKTVPEHTHILRWEDDGGAVVETGNPLPQVAGGDKHSSIDRCDVIEKCLVFEKTTMLYKIENPLKGEL